MVALVAQRVWRGGFSLIEMSFAVLIFSVALSISLPRFGRLAESIDDRSAARGLATQALAAVRHHPSRLHRWVVVHNSSARRLELQEREDWSSIPGRRGSYGVWTAFHGAGATWALGAHDRFTVEEGRDLRDLETPEGTVLVFQGTPCRAVVRIDSGGKTHRLTVDLLTGTSCDVAAKGRSR